jgi:hypothetical protein
MTDIWGHGSIGSLINMVYNTYYGMGYNNTTLTKSRFEMNSYSYSSCTIAVWVHIWIGPKYNEWDLYALSKHIESWNILCG